MYQPGLLITIDTEKDMCFVDGKWAKREFLEFRNITEGLPKSLLPIFSDNNLHSTWLISPEVISSAESVSVLMSIDNAELGTHLHGQHVEPFHEYDVDTLVGGTVMQCTYPIDVEMQKLKNLTELFTKTFKRSPKSFRAGRYGISQYTAKWLSLLGYLVDSSVVPNTKHPYPKPHNGSVDFTGLPEYPYTISSSGNIWEQGNSSFLEIPITSIAKQNGMQSPMAPVWFRPGITSISDLKSIIDYIAEENRDGIMRPLVMMFHSMEIMPGFSPYVKSQHDLDVFLNALKEASEYALEKGFIPRTLHEEYAVLTKEVAPLTLPFPQQSIEDIVDTVDAQPWFKYRYDIFGTERDPYRHSLHWIQKNIPQSAHILSTGCGVAYNLISLACNGYTHLNGLDIDDKAIHASKKLTEEFPYVQFAVDDCITLTHFSDTTFDVIEAIGWVMFNEDFPYLDFLKRAHTLLSPEGFLLIDVIDSAFNSIPQNNVHTADRNKRAEQQRPSEYLTRVSETQMQNFARISGFRIVRIIDLEIPTIPRKIYVLQKCNPCKQRAYKAEPMNKKNEQAAQGDSTHSASSMMDLFKKNYKEHFLRTKPKMLTEQDYASATFYYSAELAFLPDELKSHKVLEVGSGRGLLLRYLYEQGFKNTMGIDIDTTLAKEAGAYLRPFKIPVLNHDAFDFLATQKNQFGLITAFDIIEHFPLEEGYRIVKAIYDALIPGGIAVFRTLNMANLFGGYALYMDITHQMGFTERNLCELLYHCGFSKSELYLPQWPQGHPKSMRFEESRKFHEQLFLMQDRTLARCFDKNIVVYGVKGAAS